MTTLPLESLLIEGYRGFKRLQIDKLTRANLIVGENSVGKSSLLEAIMLYIHRGSPSAIFELLDGRRKGFWQPRWHLRDLSKYEAQRIVQDVRHIFHGRSEAVEVLPQAPAPSITIKQLSENMGLEIQFGKDTQLNGGATSPHQTKNDKLRLNVKANHKLAFLWIDETSSEYRSFEKPLHPITFVPTIGVDFEANIQYWNAISLTPLEDEVINALNAIAPHVTRLNFLDSAFDQLEKKIAYVVHNGQRVPVDTLGDGVKRMLDLALALANAKDGLFLVDEIGSGLHYSAQTKMWEFIMTLAHALNVQLFATTHSDDCVRAFQHVSNQLETVEGQIIRLEKWQDKTTAIILDEERMNFTLEEGIEVR